MRLSYALAASLHTIHLILLYLSSRDHSKREMGQPRRYCTVFHEVLDLDTLFGKPKLKKECDKTRHFPEVLLFTFLNALLEKMCES